MSCVVLALSLASLDGCAANSEGADDATAGAGSAVTESADLRQLAIDSNDPRCPKSIALNIRGDSFATGVRYTADIKSLVAPGAAAKIVGVDADTVAVKAPLAPAHLGCRGSSGRELVGYDQRSNLRVSFDGAEISVFAQELAPSLRLETSSWNNQAIFTFSENL
jgi:hypothetical protein